VGWTERPEQRPRCRFGSVAIATGSRKFHPHAACIARQQKGAETRIVDPELGVRPFRMVYDGTRYARPQQRRDYSRQPPRFYLQLDLPALRHEMPQKLLPAWAREIGIRLAQKIESDSDHADRSSVVSSSFPVCDATTAMPRKCSWYWCSASSTLVASFRRQPLRPSRDRSR
jgi:hypothetical protein